MNLKITALSAAVARIEEEQTKISKAANRAKSDKGDIRS